ncbi:MAG: hypothetical protein JWM89_950 [Acidimicrobiales bacterium]|nr:hypothetical protein [Acidimicrobiales bacterium]
MTDLLAGLRVDDINRPLERLPVSTAGLSARIRVVLHPDEDRSHWLGLEDRACTVEVADGAPLRIAADVGGEVDLVVHQSAELTRELLAGAADGADALDATMVSDGDGSHRGAPAPMDLLDRPELELLPPIPGATLVVRYQYTRGPFGPLPFWISFVDGQVHEMGTRGGPEADVEVAASYRQMALVRRGDMTVLDALADGATVTGSEGALALLAGISESPEFHRAEQACGHSGLALAALGEALADPAVALAARAAAARVLGAGWSPT